MIDSFLTVFLGLIIGFALVMGTGFALMAFYWMGVTLYRMMIPHD